MAAHRRPGDVGRLDDAGFLYVTDRKKDVILSGGQNIRIRSYVGRGPPVQTWEDAAAYARRINEIAFLHYEDNERGCTACRALLQTLRYYRSLGVTFTRVMTDNGACYKSRRFRRLLRRLGLRHLRIRPYTPRTKGKAERLLQTALREWAYARSYDSSEQRRLELSHWLHQCNWHRPHASLGYQPPISGLQLPLNNVMGFHT